jgi:hypothetical protein
VIHESISDMSYILRIFRKDVLVENELSIKKHVFLTPQMSKVLFSFVSISEIIENTVSCWYAMENGTTIFMLSYDTDPKFYKHPLSIFKHSLKQNITHTSLWSVTQVIKVNSHDMDPYYATDIFCCKRIYIYRVSVDLCSNIQIKFITNSYDLKDIKI